MAGEMGPKRPFQTSLTSLLSKLSERHGFLRPHLVLFDPETGMLRLSLAGTQPRANHASYAPGVGVTGKVFATGRSVIVEKLKGDSLFLSLLFERSDEEMERLSFISVPILAPAGDGPLSAREVIGTLNADTEFGSREDLELRRLFLEVAAALIANEAAYLQEELSHQRRLPSSGGGEITAEESRADAFIAQSKVMRHILEQAAHIAQGRAPVLLCGEPGVGKEKLARRIHASSPRSDVPLVVCHCAALPPERLEMVSHTWFFMLCKSEDFVERLLDRYDELRASVLNETYLLNYIDETLAYLGPAVERNNQRWNDAMTQWEPLTPVERNLHSHEEAVDQLKEWLYERGIWLDENIHTIRQNCHPSRTKVYDH